MPEKFNLFAVQNALGYVFKNPELIETAFIHKSYEKNGTENNARLVLVGQKLFDLIVTDYACTHSEAKGEKQLVSSINEYISTLNIAQYAKKSGLLPYLTISQLNEPIKEGAGVGNDLFFAITAAIYKDGGLPALKGFLLPMLRSCGAKEHYSPASEGRVLSRADADISAEKHISNAKLRPGKKGTTVSISKAETVNSAYEKPAKVIAEAPAQKDTPKKAEKPKKESSLAKLLSKKAKEEPEAVNEISEQPPTERRFIRDALAPVRLSDELRNYKPKKPSKAYEQTKHESASAPTPAPMPSPVPEVKENADDENYKSLLQEYIQKNVRTASVLLKYETSPLSKKEWISTVYLQDGKLATGKGENKKSAEKAAAMAAYKAVKTKGTEQYKRFVSLGDGEITPTSPSVDYVSKINQYFQKTKHLSSAPIDYEKRSSGAKKVFAVAVVYEGKEIAVGRGANPKEAKQNAAMQAAKVLGIN